MSDHSESFCPGDIGLIGPNIPHVWKSDPVYRENTPGLTARVLAIHFNDEIFKNSLSILPEMQGIYQLLYDLQFVMKFFCAAQAHIEIQMKAIIRTSGIGKLLRLIDILDFMSKTKDKQLLASKGYSKIRKSVDFDRFDKACRFMIDNFQENITLEKVSDIVGMTPTSFCRYFKKHTNKSFLTVLNEIRVGHSCKLLIESNMNISGVCYESGFNTVSNFNEQFKKIKGISPSQYIRNRKKPG